MVRPLRIEYPGAVYHVTSRGNDRKDIFKDDQDRESFLHTLHRVNERYNWICHAYCLMGNHYHVLIETPEGNLSIGMQQLNGLYTQGFNKRHRRTGHLFQGRYKAVLIQKETHLLEVCRYVVLNPVRAGIVAGPEDWIWSSYGGTVGKEGAHRCLTSEWVIRQFSDNKAKGQRAYGQFVRSGIGKESIWSEVKGQTILGHSEFADSLVDYLDGYKEVLEIPRSQRYVNRPTLERLFEENAIKDKKKRNRRIAQAILEHGYSQSEIARHLGMHYSTISNLLREKPDQ